MQAPYGVRWLIHLIWSAIVIIVMSLLLYFAALSWWCWLIFALPFTVFAGINGYIAYQRQRGREVPDFKFGDEPVSVTWLVTFLYGIIAVVSWFGMVWTIMR